jgi:hypothetical protein
MRNRYLLSELTLAAALTFGLLGLSVAQDVPPVRSLPMSEAKVNGGPEFAQGNLWMHWTADHQLGFVQGWMEGSYWGYFDACTEARIAAPTAAGIQDKCMAHIPATHQSSEEYSARVTEFYSKYPQDRALPIRRLLGKFLEPGMTAEGVHKWLDDLIESVRRSFEAK